MKEYLSELVRGSPTPAQARNVTREYLQARILGSLQRAGAMIPLAFHGSTALRFLFASARHSEDLDFALEQNRSQYDFRTYLRAIRAEFAAEGYYYNRTCHCEERSDEAISFYSGELPARDEILRSLRSLRMTFQRNYGCSTMPCNLR